MSHVFDPANVDVLLESERLEELPAEDISKYLGDGDVMDLGCGPGLYTSVVAGEVLGRVVGVDLQVEMLEKFRERGVPLNVRLVRCLGSDLPFRDGVLSSVFGVHALHEVQGDGTFVEVHRVLASGGSVVMVDWRKVEMDRGPPVGDRVSLEEARDLLVVSGFEVVVEEVIGPFYIVVGRKEGS